MALLLAQSKPDTRLLIAASNVDLSQYRTDLTDNGGWYSEAASARTALGAPHSIYVEFDYTGVETGVLVDKNGQYRIEITAGGNLVFSQNGATIYTINGPLPSPEGFKVQWSVYQSGIGVWTHEFVARLQNATIYQLFRTTAPQGTPAPGTGFAVQATTAGASIWSGTPIVCRISRRFHSRNEFNQDWVTGAYPVAPATNGESKLQGLPVETVGGQGQFAGPAYVSAGHSTITHRRRFWAPVLNESLVQRTPSDFAWSDSPPTNTTRPALGTPGPGYYWHIGHTVYRPVPPGVTWLHTRIFVEHFITGGAPVLPIKWRLFACNKINANAIVNNQEPPEPLTCYFTQELETNTNHPGAGLAGEWLDLGLLKLPVDSWGGCYIMVGASFADADNAQLAYVHNITGEPLPPQKEGLDYIDEEAGP